MIDYHLHHGENDPNVFVFYENWRSRGDWDLHNQRPFLKSFLDKRTDYLTNDIEVKVYTMRSAYGKAGHEPNKEVERS